MKPARKRKRAEVPEPTNRYQCNRLLGICQIHQKGPYGSREECDAKCSSLRVPQEVHGLIVQNLGPEDFARYTSSIPVQSVLELKQPKVRGRPTVTATMILNKITEYINQIMFNIEEGYFTDYLATLVENYVRAIRNTISNDQDEIRRAFVTILNDEKLRPAGLLPKTMAGAYSKSDEPLFESLATLGAFDLKSRRYTFDTRNIERAINEVVFDFDTRLLDDDTLGEGIPADEVIDDLYKKVILQLLKNKSHEELLAIYHRVRNLA